MQLKDIPLPNTRFLLKTALLVWCACLPAQSFGDDMNVDEICRGTRKISLPAGDRPAPASADALAGCSSIDLYLGLGTAADPEKARHCAYLEMDQGDEPVFGGASVLMMIYANGKGVPRNLDVAIKLACGMDAAPAEREGVVQDLVNLKSSKWKGSDFNLCDDVTSGYMQGHCATLQKRSDDAKRKEKLDELAANWSEKDRKALHALSVALDAFVTARVGNEVDLSGTARTALQIDEERGLLRDFISNIEELENGKLPKYSRWELGKADRELDAVCNEIQRRKQPSWATISSDGIKKTQQAWVKYREAFITFGRHKYPGVSAESWKTWLTKKRMKMLKELLGDGLPRTESF